jgi:hypothetical protein
MDWDDAVAAGVYSPKAARACFERVVAYRAKRHQAGVGSDGD